MRSEKSREERLRRLAARNMEVFRKARAPFWEGGMQVVYLLTDGHSHAMGSWSNLDEAETDMDRRYSPTPDLIR